MTPSKYTTQLLDSPWAGYPALAIVTSITTFLGSTVAAGVDVIHTSVADQVTTAVITGGVPVILTGLMRLQNYLQGKLRGGGGGEAG